MFSFAWRSVAHYSLSFISHHSALSCSVTCPSLPSIVLLESHAAMNDRELEILWIEVSFPRQHFAMAGPVDFMTRWSSSYQKSLHTRKFARFWRSNKINLLSIISSHLVKLQVPVKFDQNFSVSQVGLACYNSLVFSHLLGNLSEFPCNYICCRGNLQILAASH